MLPKDPYKKDDTFIIKGWVQIAEGTKGGPTRQWGDNSHENYMKIDPEAQRRTLEFIERNAKSGKPFYVANWPLLTSFIPNPKKVSASLPTSSWVSVLRVSESTSLILTSVIMPPPAGSLLAPGVGACWT